MSRANNRAALGADRAPCLHMRRYCLGASERGRYRDMKLHSLVPGRSDPDQVLRVAAGIPGEACV